MRATPALGGIVHSAPFRWHLGVGIAAGVLLDTFLVRTLPAPPIAVLLGRLNWWPSALARGEALAADVAPATAAAP